MHHMKLWTNATRRCCLNTDEVDPIRILKCSHNRISETRERIMKEILLHLQKSDGNIEMLHAIIDRLSDKPIEEHSDE